VSDVPPPAGLDTVAHDDDTGCLQAAKRLRSDHPRWVIIWVARTRLYHAYPLFRTRRGINVKAADPADLVTQMSDVEQASPSSRRRSRHTS
jgi:hypothetical protein